MPIHRFEYNASRPSQFLHHVTGRIGAHRTGSTDQPQIDRFAGAVLAGGRRMEDVGVVLRDLFRRTLPWNTGIFCHK
jgi:hypothetical protein